MIKFDYSEIKSSIKDKQIRSNKIKIRKYDIIVIAEIKKNRENNENR